ncbi:bifunctional oligoribonuclease/PAP phosphatase NrnA [Fictibacillus enclensis]|uniref:DHH family phosphoesterase n=1 Tax=Fictibacillus enclensis TaxID=1017270 RepID=UPI0024BF1C50|nr:bifunctional oligoribonuclease/PAP phosphatase NrnA [Fictibacillus enclensis]MDM5339378.1 bifunctional oligoribonuclease/PAP phosphatase NrnA [Fictibacillus enclensis]WHY70828.1 bifunctional oligoribonuclease/PAP phosphatase NrnA [Fictibacillus enclensis]
MKDAILETIKSYNKIVIHRHIRPDPDALGSQGGLGAILKASFPEKEIYLVGEEDPALTFLVQMDQITDDTYNGALVIVCDTANSPRISDQRYSLGDKLIKIDHHPNEEPYGDLVWVDTSASSVSQMIFEWFEHEKENGLILNKEAARLLFAGIVSDTGRFLYRNTTDRTYYAAGELVRKGISTGEIFENLYKVKESTARLNGYVLQNFTVIDGIAGYIHLPKETLEEYGVSVSEASQLVNAFANVEGIVAWVFFVDEPNQIRVRLRSKGPVINQLAMKYNGGGHPMASGATVYSEEETKQVVSDLVELCKEFVTGR